MTEKRGSKVVRSKSSSTVKKVPHKRHAKSHKRQVSRQVEEEFYVPSPKHMGKYQIPLGIKFLIGYLIFISVLYIVSFVSGLAFPTTILFGQIVTGKQAMIFNIVLLVIVGFMIYGFWKRKAFAFDLTISFFGFSTLNSMLSFTLYGADQLSSFRKLMLLSFVSLVFVNIIILWYIISEKNYFYAKSFHDRPVHQRDKVFLYTVSLFWVVTLLVGSTLGIQFYKDSKDLVDKNVKELSKDIGAGEFTCARKAGSDRDVCYLVYVNTMSYHGYDRSELCGRIENDLFRFTCTRYFGVDSDIDR